MSKFLDLEGLQQLVNLIKDKFVQKDGSKVLSDNNYTKDDMDKVRAIPENPKYTDTTYDLTPYQKTADADSKYATKEEVVGVDVSGLLKNYEEKANKGTAGGYAELDSNSKVPVGQLPEATSTSGGMLTADNFKKLSGLETGAQVNKIETIKRNGTILTVSDKAVDISVPTKVSQLTNDKTFQTKAEVQALISAAGHMEKKMVDTRPSTGQDNVLYLVPKAGGADNVYEEWLWVDSKWEKIGDTATKIDLSPYMKKTDIQAITSTEINALMGA